jgi:hypothetical protein
MSSWRKISLPQRSILIFENGVCVPDLSQWSTLNFSMSRTSLFLVAGLDCCDDSIYFSSPFAIWISLLEVARSTRVYESPTLFRYFIFSTRQQPRPVHKSSSI